MLETLTMTGLNHQTAPLALREDLARSLGSLDVALDRLRPHIDECVILSTCNRLECYTRSEVALSPFSLLAPDAAKRAAEHLITLQGADCLSHLFGVTAALNSLVIGETQILGQVREAYETACAGGSVGTALHAAFQGALQAAKEVQTKTGLGKGHLSVGSVAVDLCHQIWESLEDRHVLLIGSGEMGRMTLRALQAAKVKHISIASRTDAHARDLADACGAAVIPWASWREALGVSDVALFVVETPAPLLDRAALTTLRRPRQESLMILDLSVPRAVHEDVETLDGVYRYDLDALGALQAAHTQERSAEIEAGRNIVIRHVTRLIARLDRQDVGTLYRELDARGESLIEAELRRLKSRLPEEYHPLMREALTRYGNKLLHPVRTHAPDLVSDIDHLERLLLDKRS